MGLEFVKQYGGKRYVNDAQVYYDMISLLKEDLAKAQKHQSDMLLLTSHLAKYPKYYENEFQGRDIVEMSGQAAEKLVWASREVGRIEKNLSAAIENSKLKVVKR